MLDVAQPRISVITICRNSARTIERTLQSVTSLSYGNLQYVVVDGASVDETKSIIERYRHRIDRFISEPDQGISDALNKAIGLTDGDYHLLVHSDDTIEDDALERLAAAARESEALVVCGAVCVMDNDRLVRVFKPDPERLREKMSVPHMGALVRKSAWAAVGGYDVRRSIAMDHLLMLRILNRFGPSAFHCIGDVVARYNLGGLSDKQILRGFEEVRLNLMEEGTPKASAAFAYMRLVVKSYVSRLLARF